MNYAHPDFRNEDGSTRIEWLWDQTISGNPPEGFLTGTEYTRSQINEALAQPTREQRLAIVPSQDVVGHGSHVAGIAGGGGRGSGGNVGVAPEADFIIVKLGNPDYEGFVRNIEIMLAIRYVIEKATALGKPVAINISVGANTGPHDGNALIEQFIDDATTNWKTNIVIGSGNEGNANGHTAGRLTENHQVRFEFVINENTYNYNFSVWKSFIDVFSFQIINPAGNQTGVIVYAQGPVQFGLQNTKVYAAFAGPSPLNGDEEFAVFLTSADGQPITTGNWTVVIQGVSVIDGRFDVWGPTVEGGGQFNYFLAPVETTTLTTPSTARLCICVGAYNHVTDQLAPFSGRGFGRNNSVIKPDLVAPGVDIVGPSNTTAGYRTLSGTSMATPQVTGSAALMMEWGVVKGNNPFLYGENLKTYLLRGANREIEGVAFPSPSWGYGKLCLSRSLDLLRQQIVF